MSLVPDVIYLGIALIGVAFGGVGHFALLFGDRSGWRFRRVLWVGASGWILAVILIWYGSSALLLGKTVNIAKPNKHHFIGKSGKEWPECIPPSDSSDPYADFNNNMMSNWVPYRCSAQGKWEEDRAAEKAKLARASHIEQLYSALRTRVLTPAEEKEANDLGDNLHKPCGTSLGWCTFMPEDEVTYARQLNDAWYQQRRLQELAKKGSKTRERIASESRWLPLS